MTKAKRILLWVAIGLTGLVATGVVAIGVLNKLSENMRIERQRRLEEWRKQVYEENYAPDGRLLVNEEKVEFLLGYVNQFKKETPNDNESAEENARINQKNALIQEYRAYVERIRGQAVTEDEYDAHYQHLMDIYRELLLLEKETPREKAVIYANRLILLLEEDLFLCEVKFKDAGYAEKHNINVSLAHEVIAELKEFRQLASSEETPFEELRTMYSACLVKVEKAIPETYTLLYPYKYFPQDLNEVFDSNSD